MISAQNLAIGYNEKALHRDLNFSLSKGALTCLLGPNGAGKSTLLRTLCGLETPLAGDIQIEGEKLSRLSSAQLSRRVGLVLTDREAMGGLTVREVVEMGRYPYTGFFGRLSRADHEKVLQAMEMTGVASMSLRYLSQLSDGERQKTMIARVIAQECPCLILDEPTAFLDLNARIEIMELLHRLGTESNKAILLSTHDTDTAFQYADEFWLLSSSVGFKQGYPEDLICSGEFADFFAHTNITFDLSHGLFRQNRQNAQSVHLDVPEKWQKWIANIVYRNGFAVDSSAKMLISMNSIQNITISDATNEKYIFHSFRELAIFLKRMNQKK